MMEDIIEQSVTRHQEKTNILTSSFKFNRSVYECMIYDILKWLKDTDYKPIHELRKEFITNKYKNLQKKYRVFIKKSLLVSVYRMMIQEEKIENHPYVLLILQKKHSRNISGVSIITILTSPYPNGRSFSCKHNCYYCPNEPGQPRSYLKKEPAVARANVNHFDPLLQTEDRLNSLYQNGHHIDKLEFIIEGGTFTEYPYDYIEEFFRTMIYTCNTFKQSPRRQKYSLKKEIEINKHSNYHIIGICVETRPDVLFEDGINWIKRFRHLGITRVQLGVQHTNNTILKRVNRGHTIEQVYKAIHQLKNNGFKVDIHLMPDLPYSSPEEDKNMIYYSLKSPHIQADQIKLYPNQVVPWTVIQEWYKQGKYKPYSETHPEKLKEVLRYALDICPPWVRFPRVMRDIPDDYVQTEHYIPNMRQQLNVTSTMEIRNRECGRHPEYSPDEAQLFVRKYRASYGDEYFISYESVDRKCLFGFLRLRIPDTNVYTQFKTLYNKGLIRELHVYGNVQPVNHKNTMKHSGQHLGFGTKLLKKAEWISFQRNMKGTTIISGIGVVNYYEKRGYSLSDTYMNKDFIITRHQTIFLCILLTLTAFIIQIKLI